MKHDERGAWQHHAAFSAAFLEGRYPEPDHRPTGARLVLVRGDGVYVSSKVPSVIFNDDDVSGCSLRDQYLGHISGRAYYALEMPENWLMDGARYCPGVRELYGQVPESELALAAFAVRIIGFDRSTAFCGQCGAPTRQSLIERAKVCDRCGLVTYSRISPAIVVLIQNGTRILLARSPRFPPGLFSLVAGFVEPGETLEEAVHREVLEETGIRITNVRYAASEPWPFPQSLMVGFTADYAGGEIAIDNNEIVAAAWFDREHLPLLPSHMSLSRALIDRWAGECDPVERPAPPAG